MRRAIHHLPFVGGALYALAGLASGLSTASRAWPELLATITAIIAGALAASAARRAAPAARRPLLALSALAPLTLLPTAFQPVDELTALRLLAVAAMLDAAWTTSWVAPAQGKRALQGRILWLTMIYGGAIALSAVPEPWKFIALGWAAICLASVVITSTQRLLKPQNIVQEAAAHHALWSLLTAVLVGLAFAGLTGLESGLPFAAGAASFSFGAHRATIALEVDDTSFSARHATAPVLIAAIIALAVWLVALQGMQWTATGVVALLLGTALLSPPVGEVAKVLLDRVPPATSRAMEEVTDAFEQRAPTTPDLDELLAALTPLAAALPRGSLALVSFAPDWTAVLSDEGIEHRETSPGEPLRDMLATPARVGPLLASQIIDRSVRKTDLRPTADLLDELSTDLIVPIPGGEGGSLAGALLVGRPQRGRLRARRAAKLHRLANQIGAQLRAAVLLERAGRHIVKLERQDTLYIDQAERLQFQLDRLTEENRLLRRDRAGTTPTEVIGRSKAMRALLERIREVAAIGNGLLIRGEAGTGRTLVARMVHESSDRREGPLVQLDCTTVKTPDHLSALVGTADGTRARPGLIELADKGTLLLEEIGALSLEAQTVLIRLLASGDVARDAGEGHGPSARRVDVRVIGSTGRTTKRAMAKDTLLPELHDRLRALQLDVPPLRERRGDIPELAELFVERAVHRHGLDALTLTDEAMKVLEAYPWPGNVRQLRAVIEHAALLAQGPRISAVELPRLADVPPDTAPAFDFLDGTFDEIEREVLQLALARAKGNKAEAARRLGLKRTTFASRLRKAGL